MTKKADQKEISNNILDCFKDCGFILICQASLMLTAYVLSWTKNPSRSACWRKPFRRKSMVFLSLWLDWPVSCRIWERRCKFFVRQEKPQGMFKANGPKSTCRPGPYPIIPNFASDCHADDCWRNFGEEIDPTSFTLLRKDRRDIRV